MNPELDKIFEEADNPLEAFFAALIYMMVDLIFRAIEVVLEFGTQSQESDQGS